MVTVAVTGATGSFGSAFIPYLLEKTDYNIIGISRNETMQGLLAAALGSDRVRLVPCDIRDAGMLEWHFRRWGVDRVVHAAALKRVPNSYEHAQEYADVNVNGTISLLEAVYRADVKRVLYISSDKAVDAHNPYGATKRVAEALVLAANEAEVIWHATDGELIYTTDDTPGQWRLATAVVRGGNVWDSSGSVMRLWRRQADAGEPITVTDLIATRFHLPMDHWCEFVLRTLRMMRPADIYVPKLRAYHVGELAHAFLATAREGSYIKVIGPRRGDKRHEYLVSPSEAPYTEEREDGTYIIHPTVRGSFMALWKGTCSADAEMLTAGELLELVKGVE